MQFVAITTLLITLYGQQIVCLKENTSRIGSSDFHQSKLVSRIAFGSCMNGMFRQSKWYKEPQVVWRQILEHEPDLWIWLGDAAYADTRILPFVWKSSPLSLMAKYFNRQKNHPDYQDFLRSGVTVVGVWDDHDYGMNDGGMHFSNRLQSQDIYLDFIDEPLDSLRRRREGLYVSYSFGHGDKAVKLVLLDVRSFAVYGKYCDLLGEQQWKWLTEQLNDQTHVGLTIIASGIQILSNAQILQNWNDCPKSYDRLIWLTRQREKVIYLSGDVHFGEISCLNSSSSGYPIYELTSSGLYVACSVIYIGEQTCAWIVSNIFSHIFRITNPVMERNFGFIEIKWDTTPTEIKLQVFGKQNNIATEVVFNLGHIQKRRNPTHCPNSKSNSSSWKIYLFWTLLGFAVVTILGGALALLFFVCKIVFMVLRSLRRLGAWKSSCGSKEKEKKS